MIYLPNQKPPIWSIDPGVIAYNCQKAGMPHPVLAMPMWKGAGNRAIDLSGHGNHGTLTGQPDWVADGLDFDGTVDYVDIARSNDNINTDQGAIFIVFKPITWGGADADVIISYRVDANNNIEIYRLLDENDLRLKYKAGGVTKELSYTASSGNWYNIVLSWDTIADEVKSFINSNQNGATLTGLGNWAGSISIGKLGAARSPAQDFFNGIIDEVQIFNIALSAAQVKFLHENPYFMYQIPEELYGYVAAAPSGWTGEIMGITNPTEIMGRATSGIMEVMGI